MKAFHIKMIHRLTKVSYVVTVIAKDRSEAEMKANDWPYQDQWGSYVIVKECPGPRPLFSEVL